MVQQLLCFITLLFSLVSAASLEASPLLVKRGCSSGEVDVIVQDVNNIVTDVENIIIDLKDKTACKCELDADFQKKCEDVAKLIQDLTSKCFALDLFCLKIELLNLFCSCIFKLLQCLCNFLSCFIGYIIAVKVTIATEIWKACIAIPSVICDCLTQLCASVPVLNISIGVILGSCKSLIDTCTQTCQSNGCSSW